MAKFATKEPYVNRLARRPDATLNYEGGLAFIHDAKHTLAHIAACCLVDEKAFYEDTTSKIDELVRHVGKEDPEWVVKLAVYIRNELHLRSMPTRIAAICATIPECRPQLIRGASRILTRPDDLLEFAAMLKDDRHGLSKTLPSAAKRIIAEGLQQLDEFRAMKYRRGEGFGMKHLLKLCHPIPADRRQSLIFAYLLDPSGWLQTTDEERELIAKISAYEALRRMPRKHHQKARALVREHALPWELVIPLLGSDNEAWKAVAPVMPIMALTRNLRNLVKSGALRSPSVRSAVLDKLSNEEAVRNSKMLPFRWYSARKVLKELMTEPQYWQDAGTALKLEEALNRAVEISAEHLPRWPGRTAIACDLSGSMSECPVGEYSSIYPKDIACVLSAVAHRICEDSVVYAFGSDIAVLDLDPSRGILANAERVANTDVQYATLGYKVIEDLVKRRELVDRIVVLTDMELYGESRCLDDAQDIRSWFALYRRNVNPNTEMYFINLAAYGHFITPQREPKVTYISGWSEGILRYVSPASGGFGLVDEIGSVVL